MRSLQSILVLLACVNVCSGYWLGYHSCKDLKKYKPTLPSGEYTMYNGYGQRYKAYCEFLGTHGYMFVSKTAGVKINTGLINPSTNEVLVRHLHSDGKQLDTKLSQISSKSSIPLSIQYNTFVNYARPENYQTMGPYLYLGFLPRKVANQRTIQGFKTNGTDYSFGNCDGGPNSYLAFFFNPYNKNPTNKHNICCYSALMSDWLNVGQTASQNLHRKFFFQFEMHMGGCGGYAINGYNNLSGIHGAALGMHFEL